MRTIKFNNNGISPGIKDKKELKTFLTSIFDRENVDFQSVSYIFCRDGFLLNLNKKFLNHNTYTDIITFSLSATETPISAEIYISAERVQENSASLAVDYQEEILRVMIHGILHLCGFSDHTDAEKKIMRQRENFYLSKYGFT
ncbi:MAG TPA: rRNA maturation RNase YbeY [Ginsengibacter sp.]